MSVEINGKTLTCQQATEELRDAYNEIPEIRTLIREDDPNVGNFVETAQNVLQRLNINVFIPKKISTTEERQRLACEP
jgi:hypothetical protein